MRRVFCLSFSIICLLGLWYCGQLSDSLSGQSLFSYMGIIHSDLQGTLAQIASDCDADFGAFAMEETTLNNREDIQVYECLNYHPEAIGILMMKGSPITHAQTNHSDSVIMLSEKAALTLSPTLDCIDSFVSLNEKKYRIVGIYQHYEPLGYLTRTGELSAIIPFQGGSDFRRVYLWLRNRKASPFVFQQASHSIGEVNRSHDVGSFQAIDLNHSMKITHQQIRFWCFLMLSLLCWQALKSFSRLRSSFQQRVRGTFAIYYPFNAIVRLIWPFIKYILPQITVAAAWLAYLIFCADQLIINTQRIPKQLLDPEAWIALQKTHSIAGNLAGKMPVYPYLLNEHLQWLTIALALLGTCCLWIALKPQHKKDR